MFAYAHEVLPGGARQAPLSRSLFARPILRWLALASLLLITFYFLFPQPNLFRSLVPDPPTLDLETPPELIQEQPPLHEPPLEVSIPPSGGKLPSLWASRKAEVRDAYIHALNGYKKHAFPSDELMSISGRKSNKFNGWGVTLLDSLDTMWLMGLHDEFEETVAFVAPQRFNVSSRPDHHVSFFETTIRYLGGLLSAYALSGEPILLARADDLGQRLLAAFHATPSGLPSSDVDIMTGEIIDVSQASFAEIASCQLEFKYLAKLTGRAEYYHLPQRAMNVLYDANLTLFPDTFLADGTPFGSHMAVGGLADSGYEYLLKQWLISGDTKARDQYIRSIEGIIDNLFLVTSDRKLLYVTETYRGSHSYRLEHLSCFLAGVLALGAEKLDLPPAMKERHRWAAHGLTYTCWVSYADQETGLGPDTLKMRSGDSWVVLLKEWEAEGRPGGVPPGLGDAPPEQDGAKRDYNNLSHSYLLRPETIESIYVMWKTTGDVKWRERGYAIFEAIEKHSRTEYGYASVGSVGYPPYSKIDDMPSYFLAETLKYLYLLFDDEDPISLDKWVFNTEAHPLPVFEWSTWEKELYKP